jgi:hypothetical protein
MAAGLVKKLRLQPAQRVLLINAPEGYWESFSDLPEGLEVVQGGEGEGFDFVQLFVKNSADYERFSQVAFSSVKYDGLLWICYPKKSSKVETDLSRDILWDMTRPSGFRPVTQISIDPVWSGLRFRPADAVGR